MGLTPTQWIWHNGKLVAWQEATVHVMAHGLHYGSAVFEGIRAYATPTGSAIFRLDDHLRRLEQSARIYRLRLDWDRQQLAAACRELLIANRLDSAYLRPIAYRGVGSLAVTAEDNPVELAIGALEWGAYLGSEALEQGIEVAFSSWIRPSSHSTPLLAKACGHYLNSQLIAEEARRHGYTEGIALNDAGQISEGAGENFFLVENGVICTPPQASSVLRGLTRDTVMQLARRLGIEVRQEPLARERAYVAEEVFLTGTAAEITPVKGIDGLSIGNGGPGPVTRALQCAFFGLFDGSTADTEGWLQAVDRQPTAPAS